MFCSKCGKELKEPQDVCCEQVYVRRKDDVIVIVDQKTADVMVVGVDVKETKNGSDYKVSLP